MCSTLLSLHVSDNESMYLLLSINSLMNEIFLFMQAENRIIAMTASRSDWCISRQRTWGVPIPVFYHVDTKEPLITEETIGHIKGEGALWLLLISLLLLVDVALRYS